MRRDDLYITVPSLFRCPISLDVMKSPVSLCTGVTYDRASIQRWLDGGNNTCPATMQVLQSKELVPNRNLQRLIQNWSDSVSRRQVDAELAVPSSVVVTSKDQVKLLVKQLDNNCFSSLTKIACFARESEENHEFLARMDGFLNVVFDFMRNAESDIKSIEHIVRILDLIQSKILDKKPLLESDCLSTFLFVLQRGASDSQIQSLRLLESIAIDGESKLKIAEKEGLLLELVNSLGKEKDQRLIEANLSCLSAITKPKRVKTKLIQYRIIPQLKNLLSEPNMSVSIVEKSLKMLETLSFCEEGRMEIRHDSILVRALVQKVLKVSNKATEHSVTVLWIVCCLFSEEKAQEAVLSSSNGMTKFLLLMQSDCTSAIRQMSADLLKIFRVNSNSCLSSYDTKTTHIMPC
ncbi:U-box domain-containing protein 27 [Hibiscus syriacus]|uniref:U-box domain-containing protein n=1 Tax=Hibiscus syriacus TaxID=106335 RepID=A0A6A3BYP4_HIBSY|nr:U-box domain-containing protein 27-like [Hibiscus syriacus]KAE8720578.1 U-box domain-containing protein 27 [Hibiscus syriacus]